MDSTTTNRSFSKLISARGLVPSSSSHHSSCEALPDLIYSSEDSSCSNTRTRRRPQSQSFEGALVDSGRSHPQVVSFVAGGEKVGGSHRRSSSVSFSTIEINYFDFDLGDNPSCSSTGPPLTICWKPNSSKTLDIDTFEEGRTGKRRSEKDLKIDAFSRHDILRKTGEHSYSEIFERMDEMEKIRNERRKSSKIFRWWNTLTRFFFGAPSTRRR